MKKSIVILVSILSAGMISGCSNTPPTVGDRMITQSNNTSELGQQWKDGNSLVKSGESLRQEGEKLIDSGNDKVAEGNSLIRKGNLMMNESTLLYKNRFPNGNAVQ